MIADHQPPFRPHADPALPRCASWRLRTRDLSFGKLPTLMGIINVTPDSFSDGGRLTTVEAAVQFGERLAVEGAAILDVGGESTRPYADPVPEAEELRRVIPVVQALAEKTGLPISIDTSKSAVAEEALQAGAEIINDVTGLESDPRMMAVAVQSGAGVCAMHMRGTPQTMQDAPAYHDVVGEIHLYLQQRRDALLAAGVARERICLDPGIGFGKTHQHNVTLLANTHRFLDLGCPILVGHSRKGFLAKVIGDKEADRTAATIGVSLSLALQGIQVLRVHDVAAVRQAIELFDATGGFDGQARIID
jgi:dihydropteroate synthase